MRGLSVFLTVALTSAFAVSAHAETRSVSWQGQAIEASIAEPTRDLGPSREELMKMAHDAKPALPTRAFPGPKVRPPASGPPSNPEAWNGEAVRRHVPYRVLASG